MTQWLIRDDLPFRGSAQSFLLPDGAVAYTDGLTPEQYAVERGFPVRVVDDTEFDALLAAHYASLVSAPIEETAEQFDYALNVLPPSKWRMVRGVESFHICEYLIGDIVTWHARVGERHFTFNDFSRLSAEAVADKVGAAL